MQQNSDLENVTILEGLTSISALIGGIRSGVNGRVIQKVLLAKERLSAKEKQIGFLRAVAPELGYEIETVTDAEIDEKTNGTTHGGIIAYCSDRPIPSLSDELAREGSVWQKKDGFFVMLEGIEDPYNFGYALRSLYASGVDGVILSPRNWMSAAGIVARSSAGASELLPMAIEAPEEAARLMQRGGYRVVCAGIRDSVSLYDADMTRPLLLVVGGEKRGISRALLDRADQIVRIDYGRDFRGSLSTASAATVMAFEVLRQNGAGR